MPKNTSKATLPVIPESDNNEDNTTEIEQAEQTTAHNPLNELMAISAKNRKEVAVREMGATSRLMPASIQKIVDAGPSNHFDLGAQARDLSTEELLPELLGRIDAIHYAMDAISRAAEVYVKNGYHNKLGQAIGNAGFILRGLVQPRESRFDWFPDFVSGAIDAGDEAQNSFNDEKMA